MRTQEVWGIGDRVTGIHAAGRLAWLCGCSFHGCIIMGMKAPLINISARGAAMRRRLSRFYFVPATLLIALLVFMTNLNLSPSLLHVPLTAILVTELEAGMHFCIVKGVAPDQRCTRPSLSRAKAAAIVLGSALSCAMATSVLAMSITSCPVDTMFLMQHLPLGPVIYGVRCSPESHALFPNVERISHIPTSGGLGSDDAESAPIHTEPQQLQALDEQAPVQE